MMYKSIKGGNIDYLVGDSMHGLEMVVIIFSDLVNENLVIKVENPAINV